jgi:hypothetical protein
MKLQKGIGFYDMQKLMDRKESRIPPPPVVFPAQLPLIQTAEEFQP